MTLDYAVVDAATNTLGASFDMVMGQTPVEPTYPSGASFLASGQLVAGPSGGNARYKLTVPAFAKFIYEVYGNPTLADISWATLPFSLTQTGAIDHNRYTPASSGSLDLYVEQKATNGKYKVTFRPVTS